MTAALGSALDTRALAWLDQLLDMPAGQRAKTLAGLLAENQALHARVERMLRAAETGASSQPLRQPVQAALQSAEAVGGGQSGVTAGQVVGGYRLLHELGRGGMSVVWRAERADGAVKRQVALKMPALRLGTPADAARFERERDVLALLSHPGIARLYDVVFGNEGHAFIVMELVEGTPVTQACDERRWTVPQRLTLFLQILSAVEYAHRHLVVHRDLKPSNILVDAEGQPKLLDFGIAKLLGEPTGADLTLDSGCALTPRYAAPEQVDHGAISTATDVYALGVLLFELLTGALPYAGAGASAAEAVDAVLHATPCKPSQARLEDGHGQARGCQGVDDLRKQLAGDLDTIVLKALRKAPAERYASVDRFADDIRCFLDHRPIAARPPTVAHRARLLWRRHRIASAVGLAGMVLTGALTGAAVDQYRRSEASRARAEAVREFMFDVFEEAEPDENVAAAGAGPHRTQLIDVAVAKANAQFASDPRLRGEVLSDLGLVYGRLGSADRSLEVLASGLSLLEAHAPAADAQLNKTRARLADALWSAGQTDRASLLAEQALSACPQGADCAKARYYARNVLVNRARLQGRMQDALALMRQAVEDGEAAFGRKDPETVMAWQSLAVVARQAGDLAAASQALQHALDIGGAVTLRQADRVELSRTAALLSLDLGHLDDADRRLDELLRQADVPDEERALQWRLKANLQLVQGRAALALASASRAIELARSGDARVEALLGHQAHARASALLGAKGAASEMDEVVSGLQAAGYEAGSMEVLRARRIRAEVMLRTGQVQEGVVQLSAVAAEQQQRQDSQAIEWAQTLDLIGCVRRTQGRWAEAIEMHERARQLLASRLPREHFLLQRNALYQRAAEAVLQPTPETLARARQALRAVAQGLPTGSVWLAQWPADVAMEALPIL